MTLTDDEIRARFSAFHDAELPTEESALVRSRLDESAELRREYDGFCKVLESLSGMGAAGDEDVRRVTGQQVDLLPAIQERLHARSRGKFYRTRVSRMAGVVPFEAIAVVVLVVLLVAYVCTTLVSGVRPAGPSNAPPEQHRTQ